MVLVLIKKIQSNKCNIWDNDIILYSNICTDDTTFTNHISIYHAPEVFLAWITHHPKGLPVISRTLYLMLFKPFIIIVTLFNSTGFLYVVSWQYSPWSLSLTVASHSGLINLSLSPFEISWFISHHLLTSDINVIFQWHPFCNTHHYIPSGFHSDW